MSSRATNTSVKAEAAAAVLQALHAGHGLSPRESFVSVAVWNKKGGVGELKKLAGALSTLALLRRGSSTLRSNYVHWWPAGGYV